MYKPQESEDHHAFRTSDSRMFPPKPAKQKLLSLNFIMNSLVYNITSMDGLQVKHALTY